MISTREYLHDTTFRDTRVGSLHAQATNTIMQTKCYFGDLMVTCCPLLPRRLLTHLTRRRFVAGGA